MAVSKAVWVIAAHIPGRQGLKVKRRIEPRADALIGAIGRLKRIRPGSAAFRFAAEAAF